MAQKSPYDWPPYAIPGQPLPPYGPIYPDPPPFVIYGTEKDDLIEGTDGADDIYGRSAEDYVEGGHGNDRLYGEADNDSLYGGFGNDQLFGGTGNDYAEAGAGNDQVYGGVGRDALDGGVGNDLVFGDDGDDICSGFDGQDTVYGGVGNDKLNGGLGNDVCYGGDGDDWMDDIDLPGDTHDSFYGGEGNDRIFVDNLFGALNDAVIDGGNGFDRLELCLVDETVSRIDALAIAGVTRGIEAIGLGAAGNSVLVVNPRDVLNFSDSDTLFITGGQDALYYPLDNMVICDGAEGNWWTPTGTYAYGDILFNSYQCVVDGQVATLHVDTLLAQSGLT
jgi:Ca2+-binding RTX toxin-like protein